MALGTGISLNVVGLLGFDPSGGIAGSTEAGVLSLRLVYCAGPIFFYSIAGYFIWSYPLTPARHERLRQRIARRPNGWAQPKGLLDCWLTRNRITRDIIKTDGESIERIQRQGTIDLRIDYFSPGRGERFTVKGQPLKVGFRSISTRIEMFNDQEEMIAAGSANFIC